MRAAKLSVNRSPVGNAHLKQSHRLPHLMGPNGPDAADPKAAYGLRSALCTNRADTIARFVKELHVGTVNVREVPG